MYLHTECPSLGSRNDGSFPDGIVLTGDINASFYANEYGDQRQFEWDGEWNGGGIVRSIVCLDCDAVLWQDAAGKEVQQVELMLAEDELSTVYWGVK